MIIPTAIRVSAKPALACNDVLWIVFCGSRVGPNWELRGQIVDKVGEHHLPRLRSILVSC